MYEADCSRATAYRKLAKRAARKRSIRERLAASATEFSPLIKPIIAQSLIDRDRGHLAMPPLPHHRAYGSVPRRFDWVKLGRRRGVGADRVGGNSGCAGLVGPPGVRTCARN